MAEESTRGDAAWLTVCARTDIGRDRRNNEDAMVVAAARVGAAIPCVSATPFDVSTAPVLLAVADGMGGHASGEVASDLTVTTLREALARELRRSDPARALQAAIERANSVVTWAARAPEHHGMGSTLVAALVEQDRAYLVGIGDSRIYVMRGDKLVQVTKDQSYVQSLLDAGKLSPEQLPSFRGKNVILQAVGRTTSLGVPIDRVDLRGGDTLILCSDGLNGDVPDDALRAMAAQRPLDVACSTLIEAANTAGGHDNITVILASIFGKDPGASTSHVVRVIPFI